MLCTQCSKFALIARHFLTLLCQWRLSSNIPLVNLYTYVQCKIETKIEATRKERKRGITLHVELLIGEREMAADLCVNRIEALHFYTVQFNLYCECAKKHVDLKRNKKMLHNV